MKEVIELARRVALSLERIAMRLDLLTAAQASFVTQSIDVADIELRPGALVPRQPWQLTTNSALPLQVQASVTALEGGRFLDVWIFDSYGAVVYAAHLRAKTVKELMG